MRLVKTMALLAAGMIAFAAAAPAAWAADDPALMIRAGTADWVKAYDAGDVEAVVAQYADDAVVMPPGAAAVKGHAAIREYLAKDIAGAKAAGLVFVLGRVNDIGVSGNMAWHSGDFMVTNKSGATVDTGKYLEVWRKAGGKWRILRDIWNSDGPTRAPAPSAPAK